MSHAARKPRTPATAAHPAAAPPASSPTPSSEVQTTLDPESIRLREDEARTRNWKRWGPYLSERQWGTVREDYSADGSCWDYFPHDHARSRAYRWGEDGLLGITDRQCRLCFALALWNGRDPILKERLFGLTGPEGTCGEDVKEHYFYLDSTPTHSYMKALYKYPIAEFPYARLVEEARRRTREQGEFELADTGVFDDNRYFDVQVEYAKASPDDILIRITITNRSREAAGLTVLPTLWYRNTWTWQNPHDDCTCRPSLAAAPDGKAILAEHETLGRWRLAFAPLGPKTASPELLFTENETNFQRLWGTANPSPYVKDAFHEYIVHARRDAVNPACRGTKAALVYRLELPPGSSSTLRLRLAPDSELPQRPFDHASFDDVFSARIAEADRFYAARMPRSMPADDCLVARQAYAGLLWSKQFYYYVVEDWLKGDPTQPPPPEERKRGRNHDWLHLFNRDVISMPDKWEYPWYAAWDLAFHMIAAAQIDPHFAKEQLLLFLREWYMHPNGQLPAYEFAFSDVNPPVHAWACWRVYKITAPPGQRDLDFLERAFQKLLLNFTWWANRKDPYGRNIFAGGFLGMDNIGVFDRSRPLPNGAHLDQADGTAWMAFYCGTMLSMALELARLRSPAYEDIASKFFEHFIHIADAINTLGGTGLWDEHDGFYYDQLLMHGRPIPLRVRSMVGLIPLIAVESIPQETIDALPAFKKRMEWFLGHRQDVAAYTSYLVRDDRPDKRHRLLAIPTRERLVQVLRYMLDESEFLSPFGVRSLSKFHEDNPFVFRDGDTEASVSYVPGESNTWIFGGNSNWRGPIWFPINYLLIEALERYHRFYGDSFQVECPTGTGRMMDLWNVAQEIRLRLTSLFLPVHAHGGVAEHSAHAAPPSACFRPCLQGDRLFEQPGDHCRDLVLFHEYFHAETGRGLGASHQTGWTALAAPLLADRYWLMDKAIERRSSTASAPVDPPVPSAPGAAAEHRSAEHEPAG